MSVAFAFFVGLVTFIDPCVVATVPVFFSYLTGQHGFAGDAPGRRVSRAALVTRTLFFIAGYSTLFLAIGALVIAMGAALARVIPWVYTVGAILTIAIGLVLLGVLVKPFAGLASRLRRIVPVVQNPAGAYTIGLAMAVAWIPCVGPIMAAVVALGALIERATQGILLLAAFCGGLAVPFVVVALGAESLARRLRGLGRAFTAATALAGISMVLIGSLVLTRGYERLEHYVEQFYEQRAPSLFAWRDESQYEEWWQHWFRGEDREDTGGHEQEPPGGDH